LTLVDFLRHYRKAALRAWFRNRWIPEGKFAFRIAIAGIKELAIAGLLFRQFALTAFGAGNAGTLRLDQGLVIFALRIVRTGEKFAVAPVLDQHRAAALFAFFIGNFRFSWFTLRVLIHGARVATAILVAGAGNELAHFPQFFDQGVCRTRDSFRQPP